MNKFKKISFIIVICISFSSLAQENIQKSSSTSAEEKQKIYNGLFDNNIVKDRSLSDWNGNWYSVYPYFKAGKLDSVLAKKAEKNNKSLEYYAEYYETGYKTDISSIKIKNDTVIFLKSNGEVSSCQYTYSGFKILTYSAGNKGVRYLFECNDKKSNAPQFVQFSDHGVEPSQSGHFHLYIGNTSQDELLNEMIHWPTYYPFSYNAEEVAEEMLHH